MNIVLALAIISMAIFYVIWFWTLLVVASRADDYLERKDDEDRP